MRMHGAIDELVREDVSKSWTAQTVQSGKQLFFFCPDVTDASTLKRAQQFIDHGYRVTVFGFRPAFFAMDMLSQVISVAGTIESNFRTGR